MIANLELKKIARARIRDCEVLFKNNRHDGAIYLCGYAVEVALKARICKILKWLEFPSTKKEFQDYATFKTHNLDILLSLSGKEKKIKKKIFCRLVENSRMGSRDTLQTYWKCHKNRN